MIKGIDLTKEDRGLLATTASMVGHAILIANRDVPRRVRKKAKALKEAYSSAAKRFASNTLVQEAVVEAERASGEEVSFRSLRKGREEYLDKTLQACRKVSQILAEKASPVEGEEFKQWLLAIGEAVGESVASGELLGIGLERYSEEEIDTLKAVAEALGIKGYRAPKARTIQVGRA
ncbi:MAG: hypothetical protein SA339_13610 [Methanomassiliicoccus sp.]|nr:hypothetical protein [Methanomassiliicoccus sp.]